MTHGSKLKIRERIRESSDASSNAMVDGHGLIPTPAWYTYRRPDRRRPRVLAGECHATVADTGLSEYTTPADRNVDCLGFMANPFLR